MIAAAKKLARVLPEAVQRFFAEQFHQLAAAIAFRVLFSIAPLLIVLVSIFGLVLEDDSVRQDVVRAVVDALPVSAAGKQDVENAIDAIATPASAAGFVSLIVFVWAATGMMAAIRRGLERAMGVTVLRPAARGKLVDLALVVGAALLVLVTVGITLLGTLVQKASGGVGEVFAGGLIHAASFLITVGVVLLLYRFVPARGLHLRDGLVGAVITALLFRVIALASGWIYETTTRLSFVYGSLTVAVVFLYAVYLYASVLLLGATIAAGWSKPPGPRGEPLRTQLKRAVRGLFVGEKTPSA